MEQKDDKKIKNIRICEDCNSIYTANNHWNHKRTRMYIEKIYFREWFREYIIEHMKTLKK